MAIISGIVTAVKITRVVLAEKKKLESNAQAYLSPERAKAARLWLELMFKALEDGQANPNFAKLPTVVRWFCGASKIDNYAGTFGQNILKSQKLAQSSPLLREGDLAAWRGPAADRAQP